MNDMSVLLADTGMGYSLPVIDITNPAFALPHDAAAVAALRKDFLAFAQQQARIPAPLGKLFLWWASRRSLLVRAMVKPSEGTFLGALTTYALKLGPENLVPPFDGKIDKGFAANPTARSMRIRLSQLAHMTADALAPHLAAEPQAPLHIVNIAGGPAADSLNMLILLRQRNESLLRRPITIHVLDRETAGPRFGANALAALQKPGAPLAGVQAVFDHKIYDWNEIEPLNALLKELQSKNAIIIGASEGGLFEYGDDRAITANLAALHAAGAIVVAGSVTRNDQITRGIVARSPFGLHPRGLEEFRALAAQTGFRVALSAETLMSDQVLLAPA